MVRSNISDLTSPNELQIYLQPRQLSVTRFLQRNNHTKAHGPFLTY